MDIWQLDKLLLFIAFVIPGFISIKVYTLLYPGDKKEASSVLIEAITYSCINYAFFLPLIMVLEKNPSFKVSTFLHYILYISVLLIAPILWTFLWKQIRESDKFQKFMPHPTLKPWDFIFSQGKSYWVVITLKNGEKIGGKYSDGSFTSSYPADEQIYLKECWVINKYGGFERKKNDTDGVIVIGSEISYVEFFKLL